MRATQWRMLGMSGPALPVDRSIGPHGQKQDACLLVPRRIAGRDGVGQLFEYRVEASKTASLLPTIFDEDECTRLDLDRIAGTPISLTIDLERISFADAGYSATSSSGAGVRHINGIIENALALGDDGPETVYEFVVRPSFWLATQRENSRCFTGSIIDILHDVISPYGQIEWRISSQNNPQRDYIRQAWETDWAFFMRLCEEWGFVVWIEHNDTDHVLVIADNASAYRKHGRAYETLRYHASGGHLNEEHITAMTYASAVTPGRVTVQDHSYIAPRLLPHASPFRETYDKPRATANADYELYTRADFAQPATRRDAAYDESNWREEARHFARVKLESRTSAGSRANARGALRGIEVGKTLSVTHYPYEGGNCDYLVLGCEMDLRATGTTSSTKRTYDISASFVMQPLREPYRLPQVTPRPVMGGQEYAVIVGPNNAEMCVDKYNRALVQFVWDRDGKYDGKSAIWVRLATAWQGNGMGTVNHARCGQQVLVDYVNGDPDKPVIVSFVVDENNPVPWEMPVNQALSGMVSKSLGLGTQTNHLALDDTQDRMQAQLASDHGKSSLSLGYVTRIDSHAGRQDARGEGFELRSDKHGAIRAALGLLLTTFARSNARGKIKEIGEAIQRLTAARDIHEGAAKLAQNHGAQEAHADQAEVSSTIKSANADLKGKASSQSGDFPEFENPDIAIASAGNIHTTSAGFTHFTSEHHTAITTGGHTSIATGKSFLASAREKIAFFAYKALTFITPGRVHIESQGDNIDLIAKKVISILSEQNEIRLTAPRIIFNGGGTQAILDETGYTIRTNGQHFVHAAKHATDKPQDVPVKLPITNIADAQVIDHYRLPDTGSGLPLANQRYRITLDDGQIIEGLSTEHGETSLVMSKNMQIANIEFLRKDGSLMAIHKPMLTKTTAMAFQSNGARQYE